MILNMYITMLPVILGGILNMIFVKTRLYKEHKKPIDNYMVLKDGNRLFGDNKTWIGFLSMMVCCVITQLVWGLFSNSAGMNHRNELYLHNENTIYFNVLIGVFFGFAYMISELPNSFIKRRIGIKEGTTYKGGIGFIFFVVDQVDSLFGVILVLYFFSDINWREYLGYILLGGFTHISVNLILFKLKVRRNL